MKEATRRYRFDLLALNAGGGNKGVRVIAHLAGSVMIRGWIVYTKSQTA